jgi:hypothetical protein
LLISLVIVSGNRQQNTWEPSSANALENGKGKNAKNIFRQLYSLSS